MATILVTGAGRGIGLGLVHAFLARGDDVLAVCRKASPELRAPRVEVIEGIDVSEDDCIVRLKDAVRGRPLDVAINNAGILERETAGVLNVEGIRRQFETNAIGPLRVTSAIRASLREGSKLVIITSRMGSLADNGSGGMYGYRMSKAAVNMAAINLAHELRPAQVAVGLFHPGMVATDMGGKGGVSVEESVAGLAARIDELTLETSAKFFHANGQPLPW